jgi:hypothetical protein
MLLEIINPPIKPLELPDFQTMNLLIEHCSFEEACQRIVKQASQPCDEAERRRLARQLTKLFILATTTVSILTTHTDPSELLLQDSWLFNPKKKTEVIGLFDSCVGLLDPELVLKQLHIEYAKLLKSVYKVPGASSCKGLTSCRNFFKIAEKARKRYNMLNGIIFALFECLETHSHFELKKELVSKKLFWEKTPVQPLNPARNKDWKIYNELAAGLDEADDDLIFSDEDRPADSKENGHHHSMVALADAGGRGASVRSLARERPPAGRLLPVRICSRRLDSPIRAGHEAKRKERAEGPRGRPLLEPFRRRGRPPDGDNVFFLGERLESLHQARQPEAAARLAHDPDHARNEQRR